MVDRAPERRVVGDRIPEDDQIAVQIGKRDPVAEELADLILRKRHEGEHLADVREPGVGEYCRSAAIAAWPSFRTRLARRKRSEMKLLVVCDHPEIGGVPLLEGVAGAPLVRQQATHQEKPVGGVAGAIHRLIEAKDDPVAERHRPAAEPASSDDVGIGDLEHAVARAEAQDETNREAAGPASGGDPGRPRNVMSPCRVKAMVRTGH